MGQLYARTVPDDLIKILDNWRKQQVPVLNRSQAVTYVLKEWIDQHQKEFVKDGIITDEQMNLFDEK